MWKGVRDAECGWLEVAESWEGRRVSSVEGTRSPLDFVSSISGTISSKRNTGGAKEDDSVTPVIGLYLAILAPLRGRVELWRMRHGPCVRIIPAPQGAHLLTSVSIAGGSVDDRSGRGGVGAGALTSCLLVSGGKGAAGGLATRLQLDPLSVDEADLAILPSR